MKKILSTVDYSFLSGSNQIDFSIYPDFDPKRLLAVINTTRDQTLIYAVGGGSASPTRGEFSGSLGSYVLTLTYSTVSMADTDILQLIYDESVGIEDAKSSYDIVSGKAGLDINLLSSSFGGTLDDVMPAPFQDNAMSVAILNNGVLSAPAMNMNNELIVDVTQSGAVPVAGVVSVSAGTVTVDNFPASQAVTGTFFQATQPVSGSVSVSNFPATQAVSGSVSVSNLPTTQAVSGTFWQTTQPVSAASLPLPTNASTSALQTTGNASLSSIDGKFTTLNSNVATSTLQTSGNATLTSIDSGIVTLNAKVPTLGQKLSAASLPVVLPSDQIVNTTLPDLSITGQSAQTAIINNIIPSTAVSTSTDASGYRSASIQVVSTGTAGTFTFEGSNDNINFQTIPVYGQLILTGTPITAAITATASQLIYTLPIQTRYIRLRIVTTITGGSIQAFTRLSQASFSPAILQVAQNTNANLNVSATIASGTVTTVSTVTAVTSVASMTTLLQIGNVPANSFIYDTMNGVWASVVRGRIS